MQKVHYAINILIITPETCHQEGLCIIFFKYCNHKLLVFESPVWSFWSFSVKRRSLLSPIYSMWIPCRMCRIPWNLHGILTTFSFFWSGLYGFHAELEQKKLRNVDSIFPRTSCPSCGILQNLCRILTTFSFIWLGSVWICDAFLWPSVTFCDFVYFLWTCCLSVNFATFCDLLWLSVTFCELCDFLWLAVTFYDLLWLLWLSVNFGTFCDLLWLSVTSVTCCDFCDLLWISVNLVTFCDLLWLLWLSVNLLWHVILALMCDFGLFFGLMCDSDMIIGFEVWHWYDQIGVTYQTNKQNIKAKDQSHIKPNDHISFTHQTQRSYWVTHHQPKEQTKVTHKTQKSNLCHTSNIKIISKP